MKTEFEISYDRYALIAELANRSSSLGRTALQKKIYLLQALFDVNVGYDFTLYTYGPFTSEILSDLDVAESIGAVRIGNANSPYGGFEIKPGEEIDRITAKARLFLNKNEEKIKQLFKDFGDYNAKELELRATIVYVDQDLAKTQSSIDDLIETVKEIKPGFSVDQIKAAVNELTENKYIHLAAA
jgi:uncharacterized protein YwgA